MSRAAASEPADLSIQVERNGPGSVLVTTRGEVDHATCEQLRKSLAEIDDRVKTVTVDLRGLDFMDSTGVRCLLDAHRAAHHRGVGFRLIEGDAVKRVFEVSGVREYLDFVDAPY